MINLFPYAGLPAGQLLKIKLKNEPAFIYGTITELGPLQKQADSDDVTVASAATLQLIEDIDKYLENPAEYTSYSDFQLLSTHVESIDVTPVPQH
jgi:hypothetical protein